jgi:CheY-like chemotaxis protein
MMNLCVNARDAMPKGGELSITAQNIVLDQEHLRLNPGATAGPHLLLEVKDNGCGIPEAIREKIFEPFFTTKKMGEGTGLGLSTVAAIVRNHGGHVHVHSEIGKGTSFRIYFPAIVEQKTPPAPEAPNSLPVGNGELILIVDDEAAVRDIAKTTLETHGYRVIEAQDGAEGVALYMRHRNEIRVVLSDMDMPVMNGEAMIRSLETINPEVRVISASGFVADRATSPAPRPGIRVSLPKPYTASELLRTVRSMIAVA